MKSTEAAYDDGELTPFESYVPVTLCATRPTKMSSLHGALQAVERHPWVTIQDVRSNDLTP
jgi:hypothetical protein